jgi:Tfp pilus assembly protein PilV
MDLRLRRARIAGVRRVLVALVVVAIAVLAVAGLDIGERAADRRARAARHLSNRAHAGYSAEARNKLPGAVAGCTASPAIHGQG